MENVEDPLFGPLPREVPLDRAPLVRVVAQLRFPLLLAIEQGEEIAPFQETIASRYPILREERVQVFHTSGEPPVPPRVVWRFADESGQWRVSLASGFLALETTAYESREDLLTRLREVLGSLNEDIRPRHIDRFGLRYVDRVMIGPGEAIESIASLVREHMRGLLGATVARHCKQLLTESLFQIDDAQLLARWGLMPSGATIDQAVMAPAEQSSWILDLDMFRTTPSSGFDVEQVVTTARRFAERIYAFFRWAVTPEFLRRFGGEA